MASEPTDPNAPTRTVLPGGGDAATEDSSDPDRTRSSADRTETSAVRIPGGSEKARRPAPLQYRDPERYEVIAEHGRGGLGRVMRARDKELGRPVAIKEMLHPGLTSELRFFREALITARLEHPGIVPVHEAGRWPDGTPFYAMKLVAGRPLKVVIDEATTLEARLALLPHVIAVADAVAYAHSRGIIHRDLKPSNVIVGDFGETIVIDWGLAKDIAEPDDSTSPGEPSSAPGLTMAGTVLGTPGYMAPEQAAGAADIRSDIYAIGALLAHTLHGRAPDGASGSISAASPGPPPKVPAALLAVIAKATAMDPAARYATARALGDDLRDYQQGKLVTAHRYTLAQLIQHWASHNRRLLAVGVAGLIALTATLAVSAMRVVRERDRAEAGRQALILSNARSSLARDPTKALLWASMYRGPLHDDVQDIVGEAVARGTALNVLNEHSDVVLELRGIDAATFYSASRDGLVRRWVVAGDRVSSTVVADDINEFGSFDYHVGSKRMARVTWGRALILTDADGTETELAPPTLPDAVEFSPDGSGLLAISKKGLSIVRVDERARDPIRLETSSVSFFEVSWQADSRTVMGVGRDGATSVWDSSSGRLMSRDAGVGAAREGRVLPDGTVAVVLERGQLAIRRNGAWTVGGSIPEDCGGLTPSVTGTMFALGCDHALMVMGGDGSVLHRRPTSAQVSGIAFAQDDSRLAFVELTGNVWSVQAGSWSASRYLGHSTDMHAAPAFVGDRVVSGDAGGEIRVWSPPALQAWGRAAASSLRRVASSSDGALLATDSSNGIVRIWDARGNLKKEVKAHDGVIPTVQFSPDDRFVVTPGWDGTVRLTPVDDAATGSMVDADTSQLTGAVPLRDGYLITTASGKALLWDPRSGSSRVVLSGEHVLRRSDVYGDTVAFGSEGGDVYQYDASTDQLRLVARHPAAVDALVYSRDGRWLVTADSAGSIHFSARVPGSASDVVMSLGGGVVSAALATGTGVVAVASRDGRLKIFSLDAEAPRLVGSHYAAVKRLAFSPDGSMLAAVCDDGFVRVWNLRTREAAAFPLFTEVPQGITFAARGDSLAVTTAYELLTVRVADLTWIPVSRVERNRVIGRLNVAFQQPRRASADEHVLFGPPGAEHPR